MKLLSLVLSVFLLGCSSVDSSSLGVYTPKDSDEVDWAIGTYLPRLNIEWQNQYTLVNLDNNERYGFQVFLRQQINELLIESEAGFLKSIVIKQFAVNAQTFELFYFKDGEFVLLDEVNYGKLHKFETNLTKLKVKFPETYDFGSSTMLLLQMSFDEVYEEGSRMVFITPSVSE